MGGIEAVILGVVLGVGGPGPRGTAVDPEAFGRWFDSAASDRLEIPPEVRARARGFRYVFVAGWRNESRRGYFAQNVRELKALGVPADAIHEIHPSSDSTFDENLDEIRAGFRDAADAGPGRLVVIAHSRGACDALAFALREPDFVADRVEALFLVQGPFGGSALADYVLGDGPAPGRGMPLPARVVARAVGGRERGLLRKGRHGGIADLSRDRARDFWDRTLEDHADAVAVVGPRTYYVEAVADATRHRFLRKPVARYLDAHVGPNDGVVAEGDQSLPGLGTSLGVLDVTHTDLTHRYPAARARPRLRRALIDAIVMAVGRDAPEGPDPGRRAGQGASGE